MSARGCAETARYSGRKILSIEQICRFPNHLIGLSGTCSAPPLMRLRLRWMEPRMALALRKDNFLASHIGESISREQVLARYRQLREISKQHLDEILDCISADAFLHQARRLGLARGKT